MPDAPPIPTDPVELEEMLRDGKRMRDTLANPLQFKTFIQNYHKNVIARDDTIEAQIREQVQQGIAQFLKADPKPLHRPDLTPGPGLNGQPRNSYQVQHNRLYNQAAPGAKVDKLFAKQADFLRALSLKCNAVTRLPDGTELLEKLSENERIRNSFGTNVPADGGFLVPEEFRSDLLLVALETALIRPRATIIPMGTQRVSIPSVDTTTDATSVFGGIVCTWVDEGTQPTEVQGKFAAVALDAKKLMAYLTAPNELVADAPAFGGYLDATLPQAIAFEEDYRFMQGSGAGEPLGFA